MLLTGSVSVLAVDGEVIFPSFLSDFDTLFDEVALVLVDSVLSSKLILVAESFFGLVVPVDAIEGILSSAMFEVDSLFGLLVPFSVVVGTFVGVSSIFDDPVTVETSGTDVLLGVGFPEDVVILPDTDAVVSNVVVWNVEPVLLTDSVSVLAVDGEVIFTNFLSDVGTLFDEVALVLVDSILSSKLISVTESFFGLVIPVDAIEGILSSVMFEVDSLFGLLVPFSGTVGTFVGVSSIFDDPVTVATSETDVFLGVGFPEDVVILPDTDAVVSNVVVWNVEPVLLTDSVSVLAVDGEVIFTNFLSDVDTLFDDVALVLVDSILSSKLTLVAESFFGLVVPVDAIEGILSSVMFEVDSLFGLLDPFSGTVGTFVGVSSIFDDPVTVETSGTYVLLGVGFSEGVVIFPDTDAVVSNVVVWNVEPVLLTDSVSVLAVDGDVIVSNFLLDVDTLFDEVALVLIDSLLSSKLMSVAESFFESVVPVDSIVGFAFASPPEVDTSFGERVTVTFSAAVFPDWLMCFRLL